MTTSLFSALKTKHAPTAAHCQRVIISCSAWAKRISARDRAERSCLAGRRRKNGYPNRILRKHGKLTLDEQLIIDTSVQHDLGTLRDCTSDTALLDIFSQTKNWQKGPPRQQRSNGYFGAVRLSDAQHFGCMRCHDHPFGIPQTELPQSKVVGCNICNETTAVHSGLPIPTATTKREQPLRRDGREI